MKKILLSLVAGMFALGASAQHIGWDCSSLPEDPTTIGGSTLWGSTDWGGLPNNYVLFEEQGVKAVIEKAGYISKGNNKMSGKDYAKKIILGTNGNNRDGLDASLFDVNAYGEGEDILEKCGYMRKAGDSDQGTPVYDAVITIEVASDATICNNDAGYAIMEFEWNRGGNMGVLYMIDATKGAQVLMSAGRCANDNIQHHVARVGIQPGHKYYVLASDKGSNELYKINVDNVASAGYDVDVKNLSADVAWDCSSLPEDPTTIGGSTLWGSTDWGGLPDNYELFNAKGVKAVIEKAGYVSKGNNKMSGKDYAKKIILGTNGNNRDGLDASLFDVNAYGEGEDVLEKCGYMRKAGDSDQGTPVYDAVVTLEVDAASEICNNDAGYALATIQWNRGGNFGVLYAVDATKGAQVMMSAGRCPNDNLKHHTAQFGIQPGHKYYILSSDKGSCELYNITISKFAPVYGEVGGGEVTPGDGEKWTSTVDGEAIAAYATLGAEGEPSIVKIGGENFEGEHVSGPVADFINAEAIPLEKKYDNTWSGPKSQGLSADGSVAPLVYMQGKGNPVNLDLVTFEEITTDDIPTGVYRANWDAAYYNPDGSTQGPKNGTYVSLTSKVDGQFKVGVWVNKGNRETFVCPNTDYKAMAFGTDVKVSGYIQATTWTDEETTDANLIGQMKFQEEIHTKGTEGMDAYVLGEGNRPIWAWLTFDAKAGVTYYIFNKSTQIGLMDVEFTSGASGIETIQVVRPASNVIYNLAGQVVDKNYKGIVIVNGKKFLNK